MKRGMDRIQTQVVWADLEPWVQQLYEDHMVRVRILVPLVAPGDQIKQGAICEAYRTQLGPREEIVDRQWTVFDPDVSGLVEQYALRWVSRLLLQLEADAEREARQTALIW